jgi:hypothetical protein|tara:strand:- start:654 stop:1298 length:645 start_codon:yes stop_codon:yes gene_type:complete
MLDQIDSYFNKPVELHETAEGLSHHIKINSDSWGFTLWDGKDVSLNYNNIVKDNEKLLLEVQSDLLNNRTTTPRPKKFQAMDNVILLQGIKESIDRDIGAVSTSLDYCSLGSSSTSEAESQTDLQAEFSDTAYSRKRFSTTGTRDRVNQTMKLGMMWDDSSFDATPRTIREAGVHWASTGTAKCHARVVSTDFVLDAGDLFVVQINELQENGTL